METEWRKEGDHLLRFSERQSRPTTPPSVTEGAQRHSHDERLVKLPKLAQTYATSQNILRITAERRREDSTGAEQEQVL